MERYGVRVTINVLDRASLDRDNTLDISFTTDCDAVSMADAALHGAKLASSEVDRRFAIGPQAGDSQ